MKFLNILLFFLCCATGFSQTVNVDDISNSPTDLANILLGNACVDVSNISISSSEAVAYFNNQGGDFPLTEGIVIRTGKAKFSEGSYTGLNMSSHLNDDHDPYLDHIFDNTSQTPEVSDIAFLEFDILPLSNNFSFDFIFASNEYGDWQCVSSDVMAFLLTDLVTGTTTNLAIVPNSYEPISIRSIKDNLYNPSCDSDHQSLFSTYNPIDPGSSTINMRGHTATINVSEDIVAGNPYKIRLVVGDSNGSSDYDSAIFIAPGSFNASLSLGMDETICDGDPQTLSTGLDTSVYIHSWTKDGIPLPESGNTLVVDQTGTYGISVTNSGTGCLVTDEIVFSPLMVQAPPSEIALCNTGATSYSFDLSGITEASMGIDPLIYELVFYGSAADMAADTPIPSANLDNYSSPGGQEIFIKIKNTDTGGTCDAVYNVDLFVNDAIVMTPPGIVEVCSSRATYNLNNAIPAMLDGQNAADFNFTFYETHTEAQNGQDALENSFPIPMASSPFTVWVRVEDAQMPECFVTLSFEIEVLPAPPVSSIGDLTGCGSVELPTITDGTYYTEPGGNGAVMNAGDVISASGTYYIYSDPLPNGCSNQSSFEVFLAEEYVFDDVTVCGEYEVTDIEIGDFYTGPNGSGTIIPGGAELTDDQTIYYYLEIEGVVCIQDSFELTVLPAPDIPNYGNVTVCYQYILPSLPAGDYFLEPDGGGSPLFPGDVITSTERLYVYDDNGLCSDEDQFYVRIVQDSDMEYSDVTVCGSYILPDMPQSAWIISGGFFTEPAGGGTELPGGTAITTSQTIYFYVETTSGTNCTNNVSFDVSVIPLPEVDQLNDVMLCDQEVYELPPLTYGQYFTETDRGGTELFAGDIISETQEIFINNLGNDCVNESSFIVEHRPLPMVDNPTDIIQCDPYELPPLTYGGGYFTGPGGTGTEMQAGDLITSTQVVYVYRDYDDFASCYSENYFTAYIMGIVLDEVDDVTACDEYILPPLENGNYYTGSGESGTALFAGDVITQSQEIFIFAYNGERFVCTDEISFFVDISETPILNPIADVEACAEYTFPALPQDEYDMVYSLAPNGEEVIPVSDYLITEPGTYTIYVYATSKTNSECFNETEFELTIYPLLDLNIPNGILCVDLETGEMVSPAVLYSGLDPSEFTVNWYLNENLVFTGPTYAAEEVGVYTVETIKLQPEIGADCNYAPTTVEVLPSAPPVIAAHVTEPFAEIAVVTVQIVDGIGEYEYQFNDGPFQSSNEFYNVPSGIHTVTVRGVNSPCGETTITVEVLRYPNFFTPNGDGIHDYWNIEDLWNHSEAVITIFDRYGKIMASFAPRSMGWDGQYNGREMPSGVYWFTVDFVYQGKKELFKAHFTLKR